GVAVAGDAPGVAGLDEGARDGSRSAVRRDAPGEALPAEGACEPGGDRVEDGLDGGAGAVVGRGRVGGLLGADRRDDALVAQALRDREVLEPGVRLAARLEREVAVVVRVGVAERVARHTVADRAGLAAVDRRDEREDARVLDV